MPPKLIFQKILNLLLNQIFWEANLKKNKTKIKDNVFIGSNSSLVAPLTIEEGSVVGAGSVITKNVKKKSLALTRSIQTEVKNYRRKK